MAIKFQRSNGIFTLTTKRTAYAFQIAHGKYPVHIYYGKKGGEIKPWDPYVVSFSPYLEQFGNCWSPDIFPQEVSFFGAGDFRTSALRLSGKDGNSVTSFDYRCYRYIDGIAPIPGLPQARGGEDVKTLCITMEDKVTGCLLNLYYTVFYDCDVITRHMELINKSADDVVIEKCMSMTLDLQNDEYDMISLYGGHYDERNYCRRAIAPGNQNIFSRRGASSPQFNPFFALCDKKATETKGDVYGFNLVYSGSFLAEVEVDQMGHTRVQTGLGSECFRYTLKGGESFVSPEAVMTYSNKGIGEMSRNFHKFVLNHILPEKAVKNPHPVVLNTWEACYFNIDEEKLVAFAEESAKCGFDMLVMDDGWFGARNHDHAGLGDWTPNLNKFKNGLKSFVDRVKAKGISFGIWIEPEMVNPDSDLYRAHPDWCLRVPGRPTSLSRDQLVLDMSNPAVIDYLKQSFSKTFEGVSIDYFKWDMNRHLSEVGSAALPPKQQSEVFFRYQKGVYELIEWFNQTYPNAMIETCSGGGGRYDLGMMCYGWQIWASDNTHPYDRIWMQRSALLGYPAATMSCHVSNPGENEKSLDFRYKVAVGGMLGYELNILNMTTPIKEIMSRQTKEYHQYESIIRTGTYYNLACPFEKCYDCHYYANEDNTQFLFGVSFKRSAKAGFVTSSMKIAQADKNATYRDLLSDKVYSGEELKNGLKFEATGEEYDAKLFWFVKE